LATFDNVGFSVPAIVFATVGGKAAYAADQTSTTIEPVWSAKISQLTIVAANFHSISILTPLVIANPPPSITMFNPPLTIPLVPDEPAVPDVPDDPPPTAT